MTTRSTIACGLAGMLALGLASRAPAVGRCREAAQAERQQCVAVAKDGFRAGGDACRGLAHACVETCRTDGRQCIDRAVVKTCGARVRALVRCPGAFRECVAGCALGGAPGRTRDCIAAAAATFRADVASCAQDAVSARRGCLAKIRACVDECGAAVPPCDGAVRAARRDAIAACTRTLAAAIAACHVAFPGGGVGLERCVTRAKGEASVCRDDARLAARQGFLDCRLTLASCVAACPHQ